MGFTPLQPGELAPGLYLAEPEKLPDLLETGAHVDLTDFRNACDAIAVAPRNASRTFASTVLYLAQDLYIPDQFHDLDVGVTWWSGNPNLVNIRDRILIETQCLTDMVELYEAGSFDDPHRIFTRRNWRVMRAVVRDEFDISFERIGAQTLSIRTRKEVEPEQESPA